MAGQHQVDRCPICSKPRLRQEPTCANCGHKWYQPAPSAQPPSLQRQMYGDPRKRGNELAAGIIGVAALCGALLLFAILSANPLKRKSFGLNVGDTKDKAFRVLGEPLKCGVTGVDEEGCIWTDAPREARKGVWESIDAYFIDGRLSDIYETRHEGELGDIWIKAKP